MDLSLVPLRNNLLVDAKYQSVKNRIISRIQELGIADPKYRDDAELLCLVCNLIENLVSSKKDKICKKTLAVDIISTMFETTDDGKALLQKNIDFLCSQRGLIKKVSYYKLFRVGLKEWFFKK